MNRGQNKTLAEADLQERLVLGRLEGNLWQTWTESKSREDGGVLGRAAKKDLDIRLDGKKLNQQDSFIYLGGAVCGDGGTEMEICRRI